MHPEDAVIDDLDILHIRLNKDVNKEKICIGCENSEMCKYAKGFNALFDAIDGVSSDGYSLSWGNINCSDRNKL